MKYLDAIDRIEKFSKKQLAIAYGNLTDDWEMDADDPDRKRKLSKQELINAIVGDPIFEAGGESNPTGDYTPDDCALEFIENNCEIN